MENWNFSIAEDTLSNPFGANYDRADDLLYSDFEDVDQILSYICEQQSTGAKDEIARPKHRDSDANNLPERGLSNIGIRETMSLYAVHMEVDDSDIAAVVNSALNLTNNGNSSNEFEVLENRYSCKVEKNQPADRMNSSMCSHDQMQILDDQKPFSSIVPSDQPCTSRLSSKQNHWGPTYTSSYEYIGNPQFQHENTLLPDQCMGRFFDPSSKPPYAEPVEETIRPCHRQQAPDALLAEYLQEQASSATNSRIEKEHQQTQHGNEGGSKVDLAFDTDLSAQENSCMKQVFSNDATAEAANLLQLHNVMNEMDVGMRRCISNSLYRLARSTIRRPDLSDLNNCNSSESILATRYQSIERSKRIAEGINTDTNILDQSIAKLLFYKPLDLATASSAEAMLLRSGMLIGIPL